METLIVAETRETRYHFLDSSTSGLMVHAITRGVFVNLSQKATKPMQLSINNSTGVIAILTIMIIIKMPDGVGPTVK